MKVTYRIPTTQYGFVEIEDEEPAFVDAQDIRDKHDEYLVTLTKNPGEGIGLKALAKVIHEYCTTGGIVNGGEYDFSEKENLLIAEIKKLMRNNNK